MNNRTNALEIFVVVVLFVYVCVCVCVCVRVLCGDFLGEGTHRVLSGNLR
jgi:hypothetical protein